MPEAEASAGRTRAARCGWGRARPGARPGPACYGRGGKEATVTDANLLLGYLSAESSLAGGVTLDGDAAERVTRRLGAALGLDVLETAAGIVRVADQEMLGALRVVTVERGVDPRRYALVAFGGAGPMHAARIADQLDVRQVLLPGAAGVLSALGLIVSDRRRDLARSVLLSGAELNPHRVEAEVAALVDAARDELPGAPAEVSYDLRYRGQAFELTIDAERPDPATLRNRFERAHEQRYGYSDPDGELELVNVRVAARLPGAKPDLGAGDAIPGEAWRRTHARRHSAASGSRPAVLRGALAPGTEVTGPAVCELPTATAVVPPGWRGEVRDDGTLVLEKERA